MIRERTDEADEAGHEARHDQAGGGTTNRRVRQREVRDSDLAVDLVAADHPADHTARRAEEGAEERRMFALPTRHDGQTDRDDSRSKKDTLNVEEPAEVDRSLVEDGAPAPGPNSEDDDRDVRRDDHLVAGEGSIQSDDVAGNDG